MNIRLKESKVWGARVVLAEWKHTEQAITASNGRLCIRAKLSRVLHGYGDDSAFNIHLNRSLLLLLLVGVVVVLGSSIAVEEDEDRISVLGSVISTYQLEGR